MLDFDDISSIPRVVSKILSRDDLEVGINFGKKFMPVPIFASPMKDVCDGKLAVEISRLGGMGIIHRFMSIEDQVKEYQLTICPGGCSKNDKVFSGIDFYGSSCAIGVNGDWAERFDALYSCGCRQFTIDTANGANIRVKSVAESIAEKTTDISLIIGNVASKECYSWVQELPGVKGIRVGIAGGHACTTRNATGIYHGMVSCIRECAAVKKTGILLIADGGIRGSDDFCKAIGCGADAIMIGSLIAATSDSPAEVINLSEIGSKGLYKRYHGSASFEIQKEYRDKPRYIEGRTRLLEYTGQTLEELIVKFIDGLKSSMSYFNARNLDEYRKNISFSV